MAIEISILISVVGVLLSVATFFFGRMTAAKSDGLADGELKTDIKYIKGSVDKHDRKLDEVLGNYQGIKVEIEQLRGRLELLEQRVQMLHGEEAI